MSRMTKIPKLDSEYNVIGETTVREARENGWPRFVVRIFILSVSGKILLQQRSAHSFIFPNLWDLAAAGHVDCGDTFEAAARRELQEEVGIEATLELIEESHVAITTTDHVVGTLYKGVVTDEVVITINLDEVSQTIWVSPTQLDKMMIEDESQFMSEFVRIWKTHRVKLVT